MYFFCSDTLSVFDSTVHQVVPGTAVEISESEYAENFINPPPGTVLAADDNGRPLRVLPAVNVTLQGLLSSIDVAADAARQVVAGDLLRVVEYARARIEAEQFAAADYQGEVPPMVAAWAVSGRTPQQAADSILTEAAAYDAAIIKLRELRLEAKEAVRSYWQAENIEAASSTAGTVIVAIAAAVFGARNNDGQ